MPTAANQPSVFRKSSQFVDENGVPKISSSIPLVLLGLGLFVGVPLTAFELFKVFRMAAMGEASEGGETWALPSDYRLLLWVTGALRTLLFCWLCATAYNFFARSSKAPRMLMILFAASIGLNILEGMWELTFAAGDEGMEAELIIGAVVPAFWGVIWLIYLWRSQAVKRVFVYPLEGVEPQAATTGVES
jgi:hypothetical protein